MTKPFIPHVFRVLTTSVMRDRGDPRSAAVNFPADADFYSFVLDRAALARLGRQIDKVLREMPPPARKRRHAPSVHPKSATPCVGPDTTG